MSQRPETVFSLVVDISGEIESCCHQIIDDDMVFYGMDYGPLNKLWKKGSTGRYALGYFTQRSDAERIKLILDQDHDVQEGNIYIMIKEVPLSVLDRYPGPVRIKLDHFYAECCVNRSVLKGDENPMIFSVNRAIAFLSDENCDHHRL